MNPLRKKRLIYLMTLVVGITLGVAFTLYALRQNINLFYTPAEVVKGDIPSQRLFRVGGMVEKNSFKRMPKSLNVEFMLTDYQAHIRIQYEGILPDLFREGQGVVVQGHWNKATQLFIADEVLAKHDENYMPPSVKAALAKQHGKKPL